MIMAFRTFGAFMVLLVFTSEFKHISEIRCMKFIEYITGLNIMQPTRTYLKKKKNGSRPMTTQDRFLKSPLAPLY